MPLKRQNQVERVTFPFLIVASFPVNVPCVRNLWVSNLDISVILIVLNLVGGYVSTLIYCINTYLILEMAICLDSEYNSLTQDAF
jgi:hypothetical protein